jgi:phosphoribosyl-dephospho-CoA transferase
VDGRSDFYGGRFDRDYLDILGVKYNWEAQLDRYGVDTLLLSTKSALAGAVKQSARWKVAYDDGTAILFEAATPQNRIFTKRGNEDGAETSLSGIARVDKLNIKRIKQ